MRVRSINAAVPSFFLTLACDGDGSGTASPECADGSMRIRDCGDGTGRATERCVEGAWRPWSECNFANDLAGSQSCGDGACTGSEDCSTCSTDCACTCGDGACNGTESSATGPDDCGSNCAAMAAAMALRAPPRARRIAFRGHRHHNIRDLTKKGLTTLVLWTESPTLFLPHPAKGQSHHGGQIAAFACWEGNMGPSTVREVGNANR